MIEGPRKLVKVAAFISQLLKIDDFELEIRRKKLKKIGGGCTQTGHRSFRIVLDKRYRARDQLEVLAHEMVHVKQYLCGDLVDHSLSVEWQGILHSSSKDPDDYYLSPWEMEARALEDWIVYRWYRR